MISTVIKITSVTVTLNTRQYAYRHVLSHRVFSPRQRLPQTLIRYIPLLYTTAKANISYESMLVCLLIFTNGGCLILLFILDESPYYGNGGGGYLASPVGSTSGSPGGAKSVRVSYLSH